MLGIIREFCEHSPENRSERFLVCGACPLAEGLAINIRQLRILLGKCKSSINGSFQRMGWIGMPLKDANYQELREKLPHIRMNFAELREWSFRGYRPFSPQEHRFVHVPQVIAHAFAWPAQRETAVRMRLPSLMEVGAMRPLPTPGEASGRGVIRFPPLLFEARNDS
jgi:hypothetical protein